MAVTPLPTPVPSTADPANFSARADAFLGALPLMVTQFNAELAAFADDLVVFAVEADAAVAEMGTLYAQYDAAFNAKLALAGFKGTSATNLTVGTGAKAFTMQPGLALGPGSHINIANTAAPDVNYMLATILTYDPATGSTTTTSTTAVGAGSYSAWTITLSPVGAEWATAAEVRAGAVANKMVSPKILADAQAFVDLGDITGNVTLDLKAFIKVKARLIGNVTFLTPSNIWNGFDGLLQLTQDATGSRTAAFSTAFKKTATITLSTAAASIDAFSLYSDDTSTVKISPPLKAFV